MTYSISKLTYLPTNLSQIRYNVTGKDYDSLPEQFNWADNMVQSNDPSKKKNKRAHFMLQHQNVADWTYICIQDNLSKNAAKGARQAVINMLQMQGIETNSWPNIPVAIKYPWRIDLEEITEISDDLAVFLKKEIGCRMGTIGIKYIKEDDITIKVVLSSNNADDITEIEKVEFWDHGKQPRDIIPGMTIYIVPNDAILKDNPGIGGIKAIAKDRPYKVNSSLQHIWPSQK